MTDPLAGVFRDAWHLYRTTAARMLLVALALTDALATFLLIVVAARPPPTREGRAPRRALLWTAAVRAAPAAVILAAIWLAMTGSESFMGHFEFVVAIPAIYLMFMVVLTVPVVVIEDRPALTGLRRSWHLVRGHGSAVVDTLAKAYGLWILVMVIPIFAISIPGMTVLLQWVIPTVIVGMGYGPFVAIVLTLMYYRLEAAHRATPADPPSGPDARPEPAPAV